MRTRAVISCVYLGFFSQVAQVIVLREALTAFAGVEMVLGLTLGIWLLAVGCGGFAGNRIKLLRRRPFLALRIMYLCAGLLLPVTILAVRRIPELFGFAPGEIVGLATSLFGATVMLFPLCFLLGLLFVANARVYADTEAKWVGTVYLLEALGAALGGLVVTFLFIPLWSHLTASLGMLFLGAAVLVLIKEKGGLRYVLLFGLLLLAWLAYAGSFSPLHKLDLRTRVLNRAAGRLLAVSDSPYGQLAVTRYGEQYSLYVNGTLAVSYPDRMSAEEAVHFALLSHPAPQSVLLIGGGAGGTVYELRKHSVSVDYVELDPELVRLAREHFPAEAVAPLDDCRTIYQDGRAYLSRTGAKYDVIILNLGEPSTALVNRFFNREFFKIAKDHLLPGGVFSFRVPSSESYISPERELFLSSLHKTLIDVFLGVVVLPGPTNIFLAAAEPGVLIEASARFIARIKERGLQNEFVNEYLLPFRLTAAAYDFVGRHLHAQDAKDNTDLRPVCYFYDTILWNLHFSGPQKWVLSRLVGLSGRVVWLAGGLGVILILGICFLTRRTNTVPFLFSLFATGLTGMAMEVVLLFCFQVYLGYIYAKIGLLVACFMIGMSVGSYFLTRRVRSSAGTLMIFQFLPAAGAVAFLAVAVGVIPRGIPSGVVESIFYLLSLGFGFCGGALFVIANGLYTERFRGRAYLPVATGYGVDLAGSGLGALAVSSLFIPVWGVAFTVWLIVALNLSVIMTVALFYPRGAPG